MDFAVFDAPRPEITETEAAAIAAELYGLEGLASVLPGERDRSFRIVTNEAGYVLKVGNAAERPEIFEAQAGAIAFALTADPELPIPGVIPTSAGSLTGAHGPHPVQLTAFIEGSTPMPPPTTPGLRRSLGSLAGRLSRALRGYDHPALHRLFPWNMTQLPLLVSLLEFVPPDRRGLIEDALERFESEVLPVLSRLGGEQIIHGDIHDDNIVIDPVDPERVIGLFDFGDMSPGPRIIEMAVAATYQCFRSDPVEAMAHVVSAFHIVDPLTSGEISLLPELVKARCVQSDLMAARHVATHPENADYASDDAGNMWATLENLGAQNRETIVDRLHRACGLRTLASPGAREVLEMRRRRLGPSLELSYDTPVHARRGEGVWMIDGEGRRLLDAYNNVPQVGHAHPQVVAAIASQAAVLSTNTRYLVDEVVEYADRLARLFPDPLSVVLFTNSGSEANDLAYQMAVSVTGRHGLITTDNAYHGTTAATAAMSPQQYQTPSHAAQVRGAVVLGPDGADLLGDELNAASRRLEERGHQPAMVIFDTVFSSEGIYDMPPGFLRTARKWADETGALLVADEVQAGLGRVGSRFWGFVGDGVAPDIVTLGKPMGNGYPMGAVVTTAEIAARFAERGHFFSTFAGSPVAAAAGMAVLDVIEGERLAENADRVGDYLRRAIAGLGHPGVVEVRGPGLFVGVPMRDRVLARDVVERMRERGVLIGSTGPGEDVLKIRPPLVFTERHADILLDRLADALGGD